MSPERIHINPKQKAALTELKGMIQHRYPSASFAVRRGIEDAKELWLTTRVDTEDPDAVMDLVIERLLEFQLDEGLPVHVLPLRTPERVAALRRELATQKTL